MFSVKLTKLIEELKLENLLGDKDDYTSEIEITSTDVNRPGLQLAGYFDYYDKERIQIIGKVETTYLESISENERKLKLEKLFKAGAPAIVLCRGEKAFPEMLHFAKKYKISLLSTNIETSKFMSSLIETLNMELAPRITRHGTLVDVYGVGVLILGESGVGKSETALELVKRGHRLVADDAVEIRKTNENTLVGSAPEMIRHLIEIRGIGILDVKNMYGVGAIRQSKAIEMVISLEFWDDNKMYDRLGLVEEYINIFDIKVPSTTIPLRPGRNLAIIVEVAAMNHRQRRMGYNAAKQLNERLLKETAAKAVVGQNQEQGQGE